MISSGAEFSHPSGIFILGIAPFEGLGGRILSSGAEFRHPLGIYGLDVDPASRDFIPGKFQSFFVNDRTNINIKLLMDKGQNKVKHWMTCLERANELSPR
jgi:hypothetical protein